MSLPSEIALVVKHRLRRVAASEALAGVLGVTCANDVSARDLQKRDGSFSGAKSFDTFCPLGPAILVDPEWERLEVRTRVNGVERQHGRVGEMVFGFAELLAYASCRMTLEPGDIFLTGTPAGVGPLADGFVKRYTVFGQIALRLFSIPFKVEHAIYRCRTVSIA